MKIALASDHAGYDLKSAVVAYLVDRGIPHRDFGCGPGEVVDYVDFGVAALESVSRGECDRSILFCGTGLGMAIVANKFRGIRATPCWNAFTAEVSRRHNDSNCLTLGGRVLGPAEALAIVEAWIGLPFDGGRHERRLEKVARVEDRNFK